MAGSTARAAAASGARTDADAVDFDATVELLLAGDERAFATVYRSVHPGLVRYLSVLVGAVDAEDVASETWAQACRDLSRFKGDGDGFRGWVSTIARNRAMDHLRAQGRRPRAGASEDVLADRPALEETAEFALTSLSTESAMALIRTLPQDQAEAVLLRAVMGLDAKAAGKVLGKRPGAVRTSAYRGLRTLAAALDSADGPARDARCDVFETSGADEVL